MPGEGTLVEEESWTRVSGGKTMPDIRSNVGGAPYSSK